MPDASPVCGPLSTVKGSRPSEPNCLSANSGGLRVTLAHASLRSCTPVSTGGGGGVALPTGLLQLDLREIPPPRRMLGSMISKSQDFYKELIELRQDIKQRRDAAGEDEYDTLVVQQNALKIAVNATSYGILTV